MNKYYNFYNIHSSHDFCFKIFYIFANGIKLSVF